MTNVEPVGFVWPDPVAVCVDVVTVPEPERVKYRVHLELATTSAAHQAELVARLKDLGATPADIGQGDVPWTVLADPEGNAFCVLEPREIYQDTGPIAAVVADCADPRAMARFWDEAIDCRCPVTDDLPRRQRLTRLGLTWADEGRVGGCPQLKRAWPTFSGEGGSGSGVGGCAGRPGGLASGSSGGRLRRWRG